MIPIGLSAPPAERRPYASAALAVVLVGVFAWTLTLRRAAPALFCTDLTESAEALRTSAGSVQAFVCRWGAVPDELHRGMDLHTLLTSALVHTGWLHLLVNVAFLLAFAPRVEEDLGASGLVLVFLGTASVAGAVHVLLVPFQTDPSIGASGGVAGVLGAHLLLAPRASVRVLVAVVPVRLPTVFVLLLWAGLQLVYAALELREAGAVSYDVHVVGFVTGALAVLPALAWRPELRRWRPAGAAVVDPGEQRLTAG